MALYTVTYSPFSSVVLATIYTIIGVKVYKVLILSSEIIFLVNCISSITVSDVFARTCMCLR